MLTADTQATELRVRLSRPPRPDPSNFRLVPDHPLALEAPNRLSHPTRSPAISYAARSSLPPQSTSHVRVCAGCGLDSAVPTLH